MIYFYSYYFLKENNRNEDFNNVLLRFRKIK